MNGPLHNELPDPATLGRGTDNNTFWVPDFTPSFYQQLIYSTRGVQQRIRPDLNGGISIRNKTVKNYYTEVSKGRYADHRRGLALAAAAALGGLVLGRHLRRRARPATSATRTTRSAPGRWPSTRSRRWPRLNPDFPWADYDVEDQGDIDDDGNLFEPDGALDHVIVLHSGNDQADGGGAQGTYAEWSSSNVVGAATGGVPIPGGRTACGSSTTPPSPRTPGIGVIAHEYGHDLGLPDLYDSVGPATDSDVGWWDLMSTGSHSGRLFQTLPTHMGAWSKYVLGWIEPEVLEYGSKRAEVVLGQASRPPKGTEHAVRVNLPAKRGRGR